MLVEFFCFCNDMQDFRTIEDYIIHITPLKLSLQHNTSSNVLYNWHDITAIYNDQKNKISHINISVAKCSRT